MKALYFVILHFQVEEETVTCIESIFSSQKDGIYHIVVVDNGSKNNSGARLRDQYLNNNNVTVLISENNLGFAKGNNLGYKFAKENGAEFIYMINNDTIIKQKNCLDIIQKAYDSYSFDLLGPNIISTKTGEHQNPSKPTLQNMDTLKKMLFQHRMLYYLSFLNLDIILPKLKKKLTNSAVSQKMVNINHEEIQQGVKLHGSALVFSKGYIQKYDGLFSKTFMYSEEAILYFIVKRDNLKTVYYPPLEIYHKEDVATEELLGSSTKKRRFYYKNYVKSGLELYKLMIKHQNESV